MKHLMIPVFLPVRLSRRGRPLFGAGCTDRRRRIRMPPSTIRGRDRGCAQANELEATAYQARRSVAKLDDQQSDGRCPRDNGES